METVRFITCADDGTDQIVSFAIACGETDVRSLTLLRTPKYEVILDETERGISVSHEHETAEEIDLLKAIRIEASRVMIETRTSKYDLDVSGVNVTELIEMKALMERMNFDDRFRIEGV